LVELIVNKIVEISSDIDGIKKFRLIDNDIVSYLIRSVLTHSFMMAEEEKPIEERYRQTFESIQIRSDERVDICK
jgi:hypothetical protein